MRVKGRGPKTEPCEITKLNLTSPQRMLFTWTIRVQYSRKKLNSNGWTMKSSGTRTIFTHYRFYEKTKHGDLSVIISSSILFNMGTLGSAVEEKNPFATFIYKHLSEESTY